MRVEPRKSAARPRPAASPTCQLQPGHLQLYLGLGIATVAASIVAPTIPARSQHAHAPTTPTTTSAAPYDRHPQTEGMSPDTRMQKLAITGCMLSLEASEKPRRQR